MVICFAPVAEEKFKMAESADKTRLVFWMVVVPVVAPTVKAVASPPKLMVVAVALKILKVVEAVLIELVKNGAVAKTKLPEPVVPVTEERRLAEVIVLVTLLEPSVANNREAVDDARLTVPERVAPLMVGLEEKTREPPVPVGSLTDDLRLAEEIVVVTFLETSVANNREAVEPDKVRLTKAGEEVEVRF